MQGLGVHPGFLQALMDLSFAPQHALEQHVALQDDMINHFRPQVEIPNKLGNRVAYGAFFSGEFFILARCQRLRLPFGV